MFCFDSFVNSTTMYKTINNHCEAEKIKDFESIHKSHIFSIGSKAEEHATLVYTRNMCEKFLKELTLVNHYTKEKMEINISQCKYQISNCYNVQDALMVDINLESTDAGCSCQPFEFMGILCRHILVKTTLFSLDSPIVASRLSTTSLL